MRKRSVPVVRRVPGIPGVSSASESSARLGRSSVRSAVVSLWPTPPTRTAARWPRARPLKPDQVPLRCPCCFRTYPGTNWTNWFHLVIGHFTQMMWHTARFMACARTRGCTNDNNQLFCLYKPAGNIAGQAPFRLVDFCSSYRFLPALRSALEPKTTRWWAEAT